MIWQLNIFICFDLLQYLSCRTYRMTITKLSNSYSEGLLMVIGNDLKMKPATKLNSMNFQSRSSAILCCSILLGLFHEREFEQLQSSVASAGPHKN